MSKSALYYEQRYATRQLGPFVLLVTSLLTAVFDFRCGTAPYVLKN